MKTAKFVLGLGFVLVIFTPLTYIAEHDPSEPVTLNFWLRVLAGGWPLEGRPYPRQSLAFTLAMVLVLLLRLGPILLLIELLSLLIRDLKGRTMNIAQSLVLRDRSIKNSILTRFPENQRAAISDQIDAAFEAGNEIWEARHLVTALGERGAEKVKETLKQDIE